MFSNGPNYTKLKTNLKLAQNRLKLLEKKKTEIAQKARKEIADYLSNGKTERARIRVEHIIREDYLVEAMEVVEMYCDLLLTRFGLITQMKELDDGIAEAIYSLVWVCPRMQSDVVELKIISDIFIHKYGPQFAEKAHTATHDHRVSNKLMHKLQLEAPPKLLVEKYLIEIAKNYNIEYEPDSQVINTNDNNKDHYLIDLSDRNNLSSPGTSVLPQVGFIGYPTVPPLPRMLVPSKNSNLFNHPSTASDNTIHLATSTPAPHSPEPLVFNYNIYPYNIRNSKGNDLNAQFIEETAKPNSQPLNKLELIGRPDVHISPNVQIDLLPNVPIDFPVTSTLNEEKPDNDDIDFDDLSRRFQDLKKRQ